MNIDFVLQSAIYVVIFIVEPGKKFFFQIIQQKSNWRICENELQELISNPFLTDELRGAFDNVKFIVAGDRENEWIEEKFELKISKSEENIVENFEDIVSLRIYLRNFMVSLKLPNMIT